MRKLRSLSACTLVFIFSLASQPSAARQGWQPQASEQASRGNERRVEGTWASRADDKSNLQTSDLQLMITSPPAGCATKTLTFDELPTQPVNGLRFMGISFGFQVNGVDSDSARYNVNGPETGTNTVTEGPVLEMPVFGGVQTLTFDAPTAFLQFGIAFFSSSNLTPGFTVELFDSALQSIGTIAVNARPIIDFSEGLFSYSGTPVKKAVIRFTQFGFLAGLDNLIFCQQSFDMCLQDDSNGSLLQFNSITGNYLFTNCTGLALSGQATLINKGSVFSLQHYATDRRVLARIDTSLNKGVASIQLLSQGTMLTITDKNIINNTCTCP
jgi:hypothetical protein